MFVFPYLNFNLNGPTIGRRVKLIFLTYVVWGKMCVWVFGGGGQKKRRHTGIQTIYIYYLFAFFSLPSTTFYQFFHDKYQMKTYRIITSSAMSAQ